MWTARSFDILSGQRFELWQQDSRLSFREFFRLLRTNPAFRTWYSRTLADCPFEAFYWEHPPLTLDTVDDTAEFVLLDAPALARMRPEPEAFADQFARQPGVQVLTFPNLGHDAILIVPRPIAPLEAYPHFGTFLRCAPVAQVEMLWQVVASAVQTSLCPAPRWLSTAGLGVAWLHLRLDTRPKYYNYTAYRTAQAAADNNRDRP